MSSSSKNDISSVQPTDAVSEGTSVFGNQRDEMEDSQNYEGVQKIKDGPIYVGHVRDNDRVTKNERTIYLGKFDKDENAARAHDLVALKLSGSSAKTNFPKTQCIKNALDAMTDMSQEEVVDTVRSLSYNFSKSVSTYRGVTRDLFTGKWQASFGIGSRLETFDTEEEAARAYDIEIIRLKGQNAITNFNIKCYNVDAILHEETDEKIIYKPKDSVSDIVEAFQPFSVLENMTGKGISTMLYGKDNGKELERAMKSEASGNTEEDHDEPNEAMELDSQDEEDIDMYLNFEGPPSDNMRSTTEDDGQGS